MRAMLESRELSQKLVVLLRLPECGGGPQNYPDADVGAPMILEAKTLARSFSRRIGITPALNRIRMLWHEEAYEDKFAAALLKSARPEDCVWDIGANVGFYTEQLAAVSRYVVAFEPIAENFRCIQARNLPNVECHQLALGDRQAQVSMNRAGPYSSLISRANVSSDSQREMVDMTPGDSLVDLSRPDVVKIDVEGFELEVIRGMRTVLSSVRAAFIEVHFGLLEERGMRQAPSEIVAELKGLGFSTVKWVDASHVMAQRDGA
jgi:FkbM family methyltransferase